MGNWIRWEGDGSWDNVGIMLDGFSGESCETGQDVFWMNLEWSTGHSWVSAPLIFLKNFIKFYFEKRKQK